MAESYEDLLKQQELYEQQLEEIIEQENREIIKKNLENERNFKYPRNQKYQSAIALFIELIYQEINGVRYHQTDKSKLKRKYSTVKKKQETIKVIKALPKSNIKNRDESNSSEYSEGLSITICNGTEYRARISEWYDEKQINFLISNAYQNEVVLDWYKDTYKEINNNFIDDTLMQEFTYGISSPDFFDEFYPIGYFVNDKLFGDSSGNVFNDILRNVMKISREEDFKENEDFVTYFDYHQNGYANPIKKINLIFPFEAWSLLALNIKDNTFVKDGFLKGMQKIKKCFFLDEVECIFIDLELNKKQSKNKTKQIEKSLKKKSIRVENKQKSNKKSIKKVAKKLPKKQKKIKPFPRVVAVDPKEKTKSKKVLNKDMEVNYEDPIKSINETIGYNGKPLKTDSNQPDSNRKFYGIKSNKEYLELKKEVESIIRDKNIHSRNEEERGKKYREKVEAEYYLGQVNDEFDKGLKFQNAVTSWEQVDQGIQEAKIILQKINATHGKMGSYESNRVKLFINSENYSKANMLISVLSEKERETKNKITELRKSIVDFKRRNEDEADIKILQKEKQELDLLLLEYQKRINTLLPILSTMNSKKNEDVKYNRTRINNEMRFRFENTGLDQNMIAMGELQSSLAQMDGSSSQPYETEKYIYFEIDDFFKMKEIKEIIDYNNKKEEKKVKELIKKYKKR